MKDQINDIQLTPEQKDAICRMASAGPVALLEFRKDDVEIIPYIDKKTGKGRYMVKHNFACEYLGTGMQLGAELYTPKIPAPPESQDQLEPTPPPLSGLKRGERIIASVGGLIFSSGVVSCKIREWQRLDVQPGGIEAGGGGNIKDYALTPQGAKTPKAPVGA